jgi:hypothetical protein
VPYLWYEMAHETYRLHLATGQTEVVVDLQAATEAALHLQAAIHEAVAVSGT